MTTKFLFGFLMVSLLALFAPAGRAAALPNEDGIYEGFYGHPLLASEGWRAEGGKWDGLNLIGQTVMQNLGNITDDDPANSSSTGNLVDGDLILDQTIVMKNDKGVVFGPGTKVGFAVSTSGNDFSLLTADVLKMFVVYLYKEGKLVYTKNASSEELDVLNLSLISIGGKGIQTLTVVAPESDNDGNPMEFDSFGFGIGGVSADVISKISVHYAFVDDFVEVPIIKKYFTDASGKVAGMAFTSGKTLVNNNLEDGVVSSINIGGVYYTVHAGEQLPYGAEVGFVLTSGSLLDLNLGKAVELVFIDQFENEISKTTQVDAVGVELIGGGKAEVNMVIPTAEELGGRQVWGVKLRRISVLDVDLGATTVHYAYVRLPKPRDVKYPFVVTMDVIPAASVSYDKPLIGSVKYQNKYSDRAMFANDPNMPLSVNVIPDDIKDKTSYWTYSGTSVSGEWAVELTVASVRESQDETSYTPVGYLKLCKEKPVIGDWKYKWYFAKDKSLLASGQNGDLEFDSVTGVVDLSSVSVTLDDITADVAEDMEFSLVYGLYFNQDDSTAPENGNELSVDEVTVPCILPEFELAGPYSREELDARDGGAGGADGPSEEIAAGEWRDYLTVTVPEMIDWKTCPRQVRIYEGGTAVAALSYDSAQDKWVSADTEILGQVKVEGAYKIVVGIQEPGKTMRVECESDLSEEYRSYMAERYGTDNSSLNDAMESDKKYGSPAVLSYEFRLPEIPSSKCTLHWVRLNSSVHVFSTASVYLHDAAQPHQYAATEESGVLVNQWMGLDLAGDAMYLAEGSLFRHVNWLTDPDADDMYKETPEYSDVDDVSSVSLKYNTFHKGLDKEVLDQTCPVLTRVYVPVLPAGFSPDADADNYLAPSYLVAERSSQAGRGEDLETGIGDMVDSCEDGAEYYTLQGVRVENPGHGLYIVRRGARTEKVLF